MAKTVLNLDKVTKRYGTSRGIENVSLEVHAGEVFGFLGPNGAGKTTTIRLILDMIRPSAGHISIFNQDSRRQSVDLHRRIGYLSGDIEMDPHLTGKQYITYIANVHGNVSDKRIAHYTSMLNVELHKKIRHLSRGNKQKIGLVIALMHNPELLIFDEPTTGLDPIIQAQFNELIHDFARAGKTVFFSSHILSEVQNICDRVGFIKDGSLVAVQPLEQLLQQSFRKVRILLQRTRDAESLKNLQGMQSVKINGKVISGHFTGDTTKLVQLLARLKPRDVLIEEPQLEDLFMHYYEGD